MLKHSSKLAEQEIFKGMRIAFPEASPSTAFGSLLLNLKLKRIIIIIIIKSN